MNIDEMQAGRELDALVAEKLMGWQRTRTHETEPHAEEGESNTWWATRLISPDGETLDILDEWDDGKIYNWLSDETLTEFKEDEFSILPEYSTDIAAAWQVVGKISERYLWEVSNDPPPYTVEFYRGMGADSEEHKVKADTAPLAICRAALKAVSEREPA